jgi:hypothetical protein
MEAAAEEETADEMALAAAGELMCAVKKIIVYLFP